MDQLDRELQDLQHMVDQLKRIRQGAGPDVTVLQIWAFGLTVAIVVLALICDAHFSGIQDVLMSHKQALDILFGGR